MQNPAVKAAYQVGSHYLTMFDRMPKIVGVTWPRPRGPRPFSGEIICAPARHSRHKAAYQIWSL